MIRHGRTDYNELSHQDSLGNAVLNDLGQKQAKNLKSRIKKSTKNDSIHIYISPLPRGLFTILPYLESIYTPEEIQTIKTKYEEVRKTFKEIREKKELIAYIKNTESKKTFELIPHVYVDLRLTEYILPEMQDKEFDC